MNGPMKEPRSAPNDSTQAGCLASLKVSFGDFSRYSVAAVHGRLGQLCWFVWDVEKVDEITGRPAVIRQAPTFEEALYGLHPAHFQSCSPGCRGWIPGTDRDRIERCDDCGRFVDDDEAQRFVVELLAENYQALSTLLEHSA